MNNSQPTTERKPKKKPIFQVFTCTKRNGLDIWKDHGVAFAHKSPPEGQDEVGLEVLEGMNLIIDHFGMEIKFILRPYKEKENPAETPSTEMTVDSPSVH